MLCKWTNDSQHFLLENFDTIHDSPSHIYHSALPFSPSSSWLQKYYGAELSNEVKVVKGLPAEWGTCFRTIHFDEPPWTLSYWNGIIAVGMLYGEIQLLNAITGSCTATLSGHSDWVRSVVFSSDGILLASGGDDKTIRLWDIQTGGIIKTFSSHTGAVYSVSISANSTMIASGSKDRTFKLWNIQTGECHKTIQQQGPVLHVTFLPKKPRHLMTVCGGKVQQWDINGHLIGETNDGSHIAFSSDGAQFVLCNNKVVTVQNTDSREIIAKFIMPDVAHCCFSFDGRTVAVSANTTIYLWDTTSSDKHPTERFTGHSHFITSLAFSSPSSLVSVSDDGSVKFWQIGTSSTDTAETEKSMTNPSPSSTITLQATDNIIITSDNSGLVNLWDILTGSCKGSLQTPAKGSKIRDTQLADGRLILVWHAEESINIWDAKKGRSWPIPLINSDSKGLKDLRISGDGSKIYLCYTESFEVLSISTGEVIEEVMFEWVGSQPFLILDGSKVWVTTCTSGWQGWDFGILGSSPTKTPPSKFHPNGKILWDVCQLRVQDIVTGNVLFQLAKGLGKPVDVQWNEKNLVIIFRSGKVIILDFSHVNLQ